MDIAAGYPAGAGGDRHLLYTVDYRPRRDAVHRRAGAALGELAQGCVPVACPQHVRSRVPGTPVERVRRAEEDDLRTGERRREVHRPAVHADDQSGAREHGGEGGEVELTGEIDAGFSARGKRGTDGGEVGLFVGIVLAAGEHAAAAQIGLAKRDDLRPAFRQPEFFRTGGAGMDDDEIVRRGEVVRGEKLRRAGGNLRG